VIERLVRRHLQAFQPYQSARSETVKAKIFLDANELSLGAPIDYDGVALHRYPDPLQSDLRASLVQRLGVADDMVFCGVGSDEIIDLLIRLVCEPSSEEIAVCEPTYGMYRVAASLNNVRVRSVQLDDTFHIDLDTTIASLTPRTKILFCCSPNNPTGNLLRKADILTICEKAAGLVVVDEAYIDFAQQGSSIADSVAAVDNLVVMRTLSKAFGLAGIRLGYCIAQPEIISFLLRIKAPYNINAVTSDLAMRALHNDDFFSDSVRIIQLERARVASALQLLPAVAGIYPSDANFLLVKFRDADNVYHQLLDRGIAVRRRSEPRLKDCLRITIGTAGENALLLRYLEEIA
jgi:histidinol-phosphate aminotransferase